MQNIESSLIDKVTVVIPVSNSEKVIKNCLLSLDKNVKIQIVDNGCNDNTLQTIENLKLNSEIIKPGKNIGWGNSANLAIQNIKTDYALLLNPDTKFLDQDPLYNLLKKFIKYENIAMAAPMTLNEKLEKEDGRICFYSNYYNDNINLSFPSGDTCSLINCVYGGAVILFDVKKFKEVGGFDQNCFLYLEEDDLCYRLKKRGYLNLIFPNIKIIHQGSLSSRIPNLNWWKNWHWEWSNNYFKEKFFGKKYYFLCFLKIIKFLLKIIFYIYLNKKKYYLYSGRFNGCLAYILGKKAMDNVPDLKKNNARGIFGVIKLNKEENYTLSK